VRAQEVELTYDELTLIYKSLQATKTIGALPPQDALLENTLQDVDQTLNVLARSAPAGHPNFR
jgi:hypothetical protein